VFGIERKIKDIINNAREFRSGSRRYVDHFLTLLSEYNDLAATTLIAGNYYYYYNNYISPVQISDSLISGVKYTYTIEFNRVLQTIVKNNPGKFNNNLRSTSNISYSWPYKYDSVYEYSDYDLKRVIKNTKKQDKDQLIKIIISSADDISKITLNKVYNTKYLLLRCTAPQIEFEDAYDYRTNSNMVTLYEKDVQTILDYLYNNFLYFLNVISSFDSHATPQKFDARNGNIIYSSVYENASSANDIFYGINSTILGLQRRGQLTDKTKKTIEMAAKKLNICIRGTRYKIATYTGRDYSQVFNAYINIYNAIASNSIQFFETNIDIGNSIDIDMELDDYSSSEVIIRNLKTVQSYKGKSDKDKNITVSGQTGEKKDNNDDEEEKKVNEEK